MDYNLNVSLFGDFWAIQKQVDIAEELFVSDLNIFNLETPILTKTDIAKIPKAGPHLKGCTETLQKIQTLSENSVFSLANNHIMDYGETGLNSTTEILKKLNLKYCGVGKNNNEAQQPLIIEIKNKKIAVISVAETQFGIAQINKTGYNAFSAGIYRQITELKKSSDLIIVSIHAASEMSPFPSPDWQDTMRSLIDTGADIIHGHHAHVPQGFEKYKHGYIFYGLGNFLVEPEDWKQRKNTLWSYIPKIILKDTGTKVEINTIEIEQQNNTVVVRKSKSHETLKHQQYLNVCNEALKDKNLLTGLWQEIAIDMYEKSYDYWFNFSQKEKLNTQNLSLKERLSYIKKIITGKEITSQNNNTDKNKKLLWYVLIANFSHRKAIEDVLGILSGEITDLRTEQTKEIIKKLV